MSTPEKITRLQTTSQQIRFLSKCKCNGYIYFIYYETLFNTRFTSSEKSLVRKQVIHVDEDEDLLACDSDGIVRQTLKLFPTSVLGPTVVSG